MSRPLPGGSFFQRDSATPMEFCLWRLRPNTPYALPGKNGIVRTAPYPFRMTTINLLSFDFFYDAFRERNRLCVVFQ